MVHRNDENNYPEPSAYEAVKLLYTLKQGTKTPLATNMERFQSQLMVVE